MSGFHFLNWTQILLPFVLRSLCPVYEVKARSLYHKILKK